MKSFVILCLVLSLVVGKSTSTEYPGNCYLDCLFGASCQSGYLNCAFCFGKCIITAESSPMELKHMDNRYFCKLGCSTSLCTKFLTNKHPDVKIKVKGCVNSCSQRCTNTMN